MRVGHDKPPKAAIGKIKRPRLKKGSKSKKLLQPKPFQHKKNQSTEIKKHVKSDLTLVGESSSFLTKPSPEHQFEMPMNVENSDAENEVLHEEEKKHSSSRGIKAMDSVKMSRSQRKRQRKREIVKLQKAARASIPKPEPKEPRTSSSIVFPKRTGYVSTLDDDEKKLEAVRNRLAEMYQYTLIVRPLPRNCPASVVRDLFPSAVSVRIPYQRSTRYGFVRFRNHDEMSAAQKSVADKLLAGKQIIVEICSPHGPGGIDSSKWVEPSQRQLSDFDWRSLHVTQLPRATTRFDLAQVFPKAVGIRMPTYDDGSCRGFCTLVYKSRICALRDFEMRQGTFVHGEPIYVNFVVKSKKKASMKSAKQQFSAVCDMEINNNLTPYKDKSSGNHPIPMSTDSPDPEFTIDKDQALKTNPHLI
ncbi:unnamed protein product [Heterobilharzia americana]|nr:unnamed protein product [Heterobilharzia americana]